MSYCCTNCFFDTKIQELIKNISITGDCSFCKKKNTSCCKPRELFEVFYPLFYIYSPLEEFLIPEDTKSWEKGSPIWEQIDEDWEIFSDQIDVSQKETLLKTIIEDKESTLWTSDVLIFDKFIGTYDEESDKKITLWDRFKTEIKENNRFFPDKNNKIDEDHLELLLPNTEILLKKGSKYFRGRITESNKKYLPAQMGKPPNTRTKNGRANPIGISYLYLASDEYTAIAELKPLINSNVTVGEFIVLKDDLRIIDLRSVSPFQFVDEESFNSLIQDIKYLNSLGLELSQPVDPKATNIEYIPTQYLCEFIKKNGWDGVAYKSYFSEGYNLALFSDEKIKCTTTKLCEISMTKWEYK